MIFIHCGVVIFCWITITFSKVSISNLNHEFTPKNELDYVNYLKIILGRPDLPTVFSAELTQFTSQLSLPRNYIPFIVIALISQDPSKDKLNLRQQQIEIELKGHLLQQAVFATPHLFIISSLPWTEESNLQNLIEDTKDKEDKAVHVIRGNAKEIKKLVDMLNMETDHYQKQQKLT